MNKQSLITSLLNCNLDNDSKLYLINLVNNLKEEERESSAKEKEEEVSFDTMEVVSLRSEDSNTYVILSEESIRKGLTRGVGINKMQQDILGVEYLNKGWLQGLIGKSIPKADYDKFLSLKGATAK